MSDHPSNTAVIDRFEFNVNVRFNVLPFPTQSRLWVFRSSMPKLRQADLEMLLKKTDFSKEDIQDWYQIFLRECPDGKLDKDTVLDLLEGSVS